MMELGLEDLHRELHENGEDVPEVEAELIEPESAPVKRKYTTRPNTEQARKRQQDAMKLLAKDPKLTPTGLTTQLRRLGYPASDWSSAKTLAKLRKGKEKKAGPTKVYMKLPEAEPVKAPTPAIPKHAVVQICEMLSKLGYTDVWMSTGDDARTLIVKATLK